MEENPAPYGTDLGSAASFDLVWPTGMAGWASWAFQWNGTQAITPRLDPVVAPDGDVVVVVVTGTRDNPLFGIPGWILRGQDSLFPFARPNEVEPGDNLWIIVANPDAVALTLKLDVSAGGLGTEHPVPSHTGEIVHTGRNDAAIMPSMEGVYEAEAFVDHASAAFVVLSSVYTYAFSTGAHFGRAIAEFADGTHQEHELQGQSVPLDQTSDRRLAIATYGRSCQPLGTSSIEHSYTAVGMTASAIGIALLGAPIGVDSCAV